MSQNQFSNLGSQYSSEAEEKKAAELRAARRWEVFRRVRIVFMLFLLAAATAASFTHWVEIGDRTSKVVSKVPARFHSSSAAKAEQQTKAKTLDIGRQSTKQDRILDETDK